MGVVAQSILKPHAAVVSLVVLVEDSCRDLMVRRSESLVKLCEQGRIPCPVRLWNR